MTRSASIDRALRDAVDLRALARGSADPSLRAQLEEIARRRGADAGPSVPKLRAARLLGVSVTALDRWIERHAIPVLRRPSSSRQELETRALIELALEVAALRASGRKRGLLAVALKNLRSAEHPRPAPMGSRDYFPDQSLERLHEAIVLTPGERVAQAIRLSRSATRIAAAARAARVAPA